MSAVTYERTFIGLSLFITLHGETCVFKFYYIYLLALEVFFQVLQSSSTKYSIQISSKTGRTHFSTAHSFKRFRTRRYWLLTDTAANQAVHAAFQRPELRMRIVYVYVAEQHTFTPEQHQRPAL